MSNHSALIVPCNSSFALMSALRTYEGAFEPQLRMNFVNARTKDFIDDFMPSAFMATGSRAMYTRHVHVADVLMGDWEILPLVRR